MSYLTPLSPLYGISVYPLALPLRPSLSSAVDGQQELRLGVVLPQTHFKGRLYDQTIKRAIDEFARHEHLREVS